MVVELEVAVGAGGGGGLVVAGWGGLGKEKKKRVKLEIFGGIGDILSNFGTIFNSSDIIFSLGPQ